MSALWGPGMLAMRVRDSREGWGHEGPPTPPWRERNRREHKPWAVNPAPRCGETLVLGPPCSGRTRAFFLLLTRQQQPISFRAIRWCDFFPETPCLRTLSETTINRRQLILAVLRGGGPASACAHSNVNSISLLMIESGERLRVYQADKWTAHHSEKIIPVMH